MDFFTILISVVCFIAGMVVHSFAYKKNHAKALTPAASKRSVAAKKGHATRKEASVKLAPAFEKKPESKDEVGVN